MTIIRKYSYLTAFFCLVLFFSFFTVLSHNSDETQMSLVQIEKGDTLWTLADSFSGNMPHEEWINEIMQQNNLDSHKIVAGQSIKIPSDQLKYAPDDTIKLAGDDQ